MGVNYDRVNTSAGRSKRRASDGEDACGPRWAKPRDAAPAFAEGVYVVVGRGLVGVVVRCDSDPSGCVVIDTGDGVERKFRIVGARPA